MFIFSHDFVQMLLESLAPWQTNAAVPSLNLNFLSNLMGVIATIGALLIARDWAL
jgi:hypothetical protein